MLIFGIDQSTSCSGVSLLDFRVDPSKGFELVKILFSSQEKINTTKFDLQERIYKQMVFIRRSLIYCIDLYGVDFMVREKHDPNGTKANQMFMCSGVVDAIACSKDFLFKKGNYKQLTPIQWRMVSIMEPCFGFKKSTIKENKEYCDFFKQSLCIDGIRDIDSSDIMDSIGLAYSVGVLESSKINKNYFQSLHEEQKRNIYKDGIFKEWK